MCLSKEIELFIISIDGGLGLFMFIADFQVNLGSST